MQIGIGTGRLRRMAREGKPAEEIQAEKNRALGRIYAFLCSCYGRPPESFDFEYYDQDKVYHAERGLTPTAFAEKYVADLLAETVSENTKDNIRNALALLGYSAGQPAEAKPRVLVVTSDYHVARALQIARDQGLRAWGRSAPTLPEYWLKNRAREALGWGKYLLNKLLGK